MPTQTELQLASRYTGAVRFIAALHHATRGQQGRFGSIADCAEQAGIHGAEVKLAVRTAEAAGFLVVHIDQTQAMLTAKGLRFTS